MKKEKTYNEAVDGDEGFVPGEGYPSCDGEPCANVSDTADDATDTMADDDPAAEDDAAKALEAAVAQWQDKFVRLQAEFDNYRKRTLKEKMELVQTGGRDVLLAMLPVRDDVQRAVDAMQKSDDLEALRATDGVESVMGAYETDAMATIKGEQLAVRIHSLPPAALASDTGDGVNAVSEDEGYLNRPVLLEGEWPRASRPASASKRR